MEDAGVRKRKRDGTEAVGVSGDGAAVDAGCYDKELVVVVMEDEGYEGIAEESVEEVMRWLEMEISPGKGDGGGEFVTINGNEESCGPSFSAAASTVMATVTVDTRAGGPPPPPTAVPCPWPSAHPDQAESSSREEDVDTADLPEFDEEWLVELHRWAAAGCLSTP